MMKRGFSIFCSFIILALCGLFPVGAEARPGNENSNFDRKMVQADTAGSEIAPVNLIGNGNLENGYENFSVGLNLFGYGSWALKQNEPQNAHGGNAYLELNGITENAGGLRCPVMLENNVPYYISVWLKLPAGASADFHLYFTDASYSWIPLGDGAVTVGDEWTNLTAVYTVEGTPGGSTALTLWPHQMSAPVTPVYYADDWSVERQTAVRCEIGGAERVRLPQPGTGEAISPFSVKVFDQMGVELAAEATWSVTGVDGGEAAGVSITADGVLHAAESAAEGEVRITCQAQTTAGVITASCVVSLYAELDYAELVKDEVEKLSFSQISGEEITAVTKDLKLPEQITAEGLVIALEWRSDNEAVLSVLPGKGAVTRSPDADEAVTLTVTGTLGDDSWDKSFDIIVKKAPETGVTPVNLFTNPGFEDESVSTWATEGCGFTRVDTEAHSGNYAAKVHGITGSAGSLRAPASLKGGKTYICSIWVKMPEGRSGSFQMLTEPDWQMPGKTTAATDQWTRVTGLYTPAVDSSNFALRMSQMGGFSDHYYTDDWSIEEQMPVSVAINGSDSIRLPQAGSGESNVKSYGAITLDQIGTELKGSLDWSVARADGGSADGIQITSDGVLNVSEGAREGTLIVTCTSTVGDIAVSGTKEVMVYPYLDEEKTVSNEVGKITFSMLSQESQTSVTKDLTLPEVLEAENIQIKLSWKSGAPSVLSDSGAVNPSEMEDKTVTLTVVGVLGDYSAEKTFSITVKRLWNIAQDGGFEDTAANNWMSSTGSEITRTDALAHSGTYSAEVAENETIYQEMTRITKDHTYHISAWMRGDAAEQVSVGLIQGENFKELKRLTASAGKWENVSLAFVYGGGAAPKLALKASGRVYADDIEVVDITLAADEAARAVLNAEKTRTKEAIKKARECIDQLPDNDLKDTLDDRLGKVSEAPERNNGRGSGGGSSSGGGKITAVNVSEMEQDDRAQQLVYDTENQIRFQDIENHWAKDDILVLLEKNIVNGKSNSAFAPDESVSRAEFAKMTALAMGLEPAAYDGSFTDVGNGDWFCGFVAAAARSGMMQGSDGRFRPNDSLTREEAGKIIVTAYEMKTGQTVQDAGELSFEDTDAVSEWAVEYLSKAVSLGFLKGMPENRLEPAGAVSRAQAAAMLNRFLKSAA